MPLARRALFALPLALSLLFACAHEPVAATASPPPCPYSDANDGTQSYDLLCREPVSNRATVKHILVGWTKGRTYEEAQAVARELLQKLRAGDAIEPLMAQYSEDPGSASTGASYDVTPAAALVSPFKALSLRLNVGEAGIVKSDFGLHVIQRVR